MTWPISCLSDYSLIRDLFFCQLILLYCEVKKILTLAVIFCWTLINLLTQRFKLHQTFSFVSNLSMHLIMYLCKSSEKEDNVYNSYWFIYVFM